MFEPGDKVRLTEKGDMPDYDPGKIWVVISYPRKLWHDMYVTIGDEDGREKTVNIEHLQKADDGGDQCAGCSM